MTKPRRMADGFSGQHLVVLPEAVKREAENKALLRGLLVTDAGVFPRAAGHFVERPKGAVTHLIVYCSAGHGWVRLSGQLMDVKPGSFFWIPAGVPHEYGSKEESPWTIEWAHFCGAESQAWREFLQIPVGGGGLAVDGAAGAEIRLGRAWELLEQGYTLANLVEAAVVLRTTFTVLSRKLYAGVGGRTAPERVRATGEWMRTHLKQSVRLAELAEMSAVSVPHYCVLFKEQTGYTPIDWLIRLRVQRACQLLDTTMMAVSRVAEEAGFADPYYFTRCFRKVMGMTPSNYRRVRKG